MIAARFHTARRQYQCEASHTWAHDGTIRKGDRYCVVVASPNHGDLGNRGWLWMRLCLACGEGYGHVDPVVGDRGGRR